MENFQTFFLNHFFKKCEMSYFFLYLVIYLAFVGVSVVVTKRHD